jgi:hypothetical protein
VLQAWQLNRTSHFDYEEHVIIFLVEGDPTEGFLKPLAGMAGRARLVAATWDEKCGSHHAKGC